jgi:3-phenylpropionate/trans-cinnamate dioxygenase ferredoxin reductase subunit
MSEHFVILGAGQAGAQAAATLRQRGFAGRLTLVGSEPYPPYQRPPLSKKFLAGKLPLERMLIKPESFYAAREIDLLLDTTAETLHLESRGIALSNGHRLAYDKLLLALGSKVRRLAVPGHELSGVHYLRTVADVQRIRAELTAGKRLVIVGGGYIGLEVAAITAQLGLEVTVVEAAERLMARVVSPLVSEYYQARHATAGVAVRCNRAVTAFSGTERVEAVHTAAGDELGCDMVIAGIGVLPVTALAERAGIACADGIQVDEFTRTSATNVFAAGDCTNHPNSLLGRRCRLESVQNAADQGKAAALNMLGDRLPYAPLPWFWSDQYELKLQIAGIPSGAEQQVLRGEPAADSFAVFYLADGKVIAVEAVNRPRAFMAGKKLIAGRARVSSAQLANTDQPLTDLTRQAAAAG